MKPIIKRRLKEYSGSEIVSLILVLNTDYGTFKGVGVAEVFGESKPVIIDRHYLNLPYEVNLEEEILRGNEHIVNIINDNGKKFDEISRKLA